MPVVIEGKEQPSQKRSASRAALLVWLMNSRKPRYRGFLDGKPVGELGGCGGTP